MSERYVNSHTAHDALVEHAVLAEDELRRSEHRFRALVEATPQTAWTWIPDGPIASRQSSRWWEELNGQSVEEQLSVQDAWLQVVHPDDHDRAATMWADAIHARVSFSAQYRVRARAGDGGMCKCVVCPLEMMRA